MEHDPELRSVRFAGCFGWLHTPANGLSNGLAVVMCQGLSTDGLTGYRPFRLLATALARAGYPTLRFDYPGTGNSGNTDVDEIWQLWQASIDAAVDWLRQHDLADRVVLCGLRAGATLATEVSAVRRDVVGLLLLEPVIRGRSYLRQLSIEAGGNSADLSAAGPLAVHELRLSAATVQRISQIDLRLFRPGSSCRIGVFTQAPTRPASECIAAWRSAGLTVDSHDFSGLEAMLRPVLMSHMASIDAASILAWLNSIPRSAPISFASEQLPVEGVLLEAVYMETVMRFGHQERLFGILCEPSGHSDLYMAVVITNSSGNPTSGFGRFGVELARGMATSGIASLRMDFTGLGDSVSHDDNPTHIFETDRREELRSAVDLLMSRGYRRIAIQGLCSGAYHALHGAFDDPRVNVLLLVNLQHFAWEGGDRVELKGYALRRPAHFLKKLGSPTVWINLFSGKYDVSGIIAVQFDRLSDKTRWLRLGSGKRAAKDAVRPPTITDRLQDLSLRASTLFLMSEGDEGVVTLSNELGPALELPGASVQVVPDVDHSLSSGAMRQVAIERIITFLEKHNVPEHAASHQLLEVSAA